MYVQVDEEKKKKLANKATKKKRKKKRKKLLTWTKPMYKCTWTFSSIKQLHFLLSIFFQFWGENFLLGLERKHSDPTTKFSTLPPKFLSLNFSLLNFLFSLKSLQTNTFLAYVINWFKCYHQRKKKTGSFVKFSSFCDLKLCMKNKSIDRIVNNIQIERNLICMIRT